MKKRPTASAPAVLHPVRRTGWRAAAGYLCFLLAAAATLASCSKQIDYAALTSDGQLSTPSNDPNDPDSTKDFLQETQIIPDALSADIYRPAEYIVSPAEHEETLQAELVTGEQNYTSGFEGFNGDGFICLADHAYTSVTVTVPTGQHYDIGVRLAGNSAKTAIITGGETEIDSPDGEYRTIDGTVCGAVYAGSGNEFTTCWLRGVYLNKGENKLTFQALQGSSYIDEITVKNGSTVQKAAYSISNTCADPNASVMTKTVKRYLADVYGNRVITGQFCSSGTNTEINAIYMATNRYSAIRCADIGIFTDHYKGYDKNDENEIDTAKNWWKRGGLVSYSWYWVSPTEEASCYTKLTDFDIKKAVSDNELVPVLSPASLDTYVRTGRISSECMELITDIDSVAQKLKLLEADDVPVLFRPMPEAGNGWYWWGMDKDSYLWLYKFLFRRLTEYHHLTNIIWVWDGESYDFYPGDDYVDIVGMDMYTRSDISGNSRMSDAIGYTIKSKATALTECGRIPNPDLLVRDNAYWLWFALWKGDYIINADGSIQYSHVSATELDYAYNNELFITLDELPDFSKY